MRKITTYADYKREQQTRDRIKKGVLWVCVAVFGFAAVFGLGYLAGTRVSAQMAQIGERVAGFVDGVAAAERCEADGGSGYILGSDGAFRCLYD
jgi:hypothetical protein